MLVYVDESGDTGFKFLKNSSPYFTVAAVLFRNPAIAMQCSEAIARLAKRVGRKTEYKFSAANDEAKRCFFETVMNFGFEYAAVVINKSKLTGEGFRHKESLIKTGIRYTFSHLKEINNATVVVDRCGDRDFRRTLQNYLRREVKKDDGAQAIRRVRTTSSHSDRLVQLADMVCGAVARSYTSNRDNPSEFRKMIRAREGMVQFWPR